MIGGVTTIVHVSTMRRIVVGVAWLATLTGAILLVAASQIVFLDPTGAGFTLVFVSLAFDVMAFGSVGAILALRRPDNTVGLVLIVAGLLLVQTFLGFVLRSGTSRTVASTGNTLAGLLGAGGRARDLPDRHRGRSRSWRSSSLTATCPGPRWRWPVGVIAGMLAARVPPRRRPARRHRRRPGGQSDSASPVSHGWRPSRRSGNPLVRSP